MNIKDALIVIDMQNDFINGALANKAAEAIVDDIVDKIREYKEQNKYIILTRDTHGINYDDTLEGKYLPVKHCIVYTDGWMLHPKINDEIKNYRYAICINKNKFAADWQYTNRELTDLLDSLNKKCIEICGTCTDICVVSNALELKRLLDHSDIYIDANCCAGTTEENHRAALITMKNCQIIVDNL